MSPRPALLLLLVLAAPPATAGEADPAGELLKPLAQGAGARAGVVAKLVEGAAGQDEAARKLAAEALGRLGPQDSALAAGFAAALGDARPQARAFAVQALLRVPSAEPAVLQALVNRTREPDLELRVRVIQALAAAGPAAKPCLQVLAGMLSDQEPRVRAAAAESLGALRAEAKPALQLLANLLADKEPAVRRAAVRAFGRIGDPAALAVLVQFAQLAKEDTDLEAAYAAFLDLGEAGVAAREALRKLVYDRKEKWGLVDLKGLAALARMTGQADPYARDLAAFLKDGERKKAAAELLGRAPAAAAGVTDAVVEGLKDPAIAPAGARILGRVGSVSRAGGAPAGKGLVPALVELLDSDDDAAGAAALRALGDLGDPAAAPEIAKRADKFGDASQVWLQYALTRLKQEPDRAMARLRVMGADPWKFRRLAQLVMQYLEAGGRGEAADADEGG